MNFLLTFFYIMIMLLGGSIALECFICGQYNDGMGSVTPCYNESNVKLMKCSDPQANFCIKYMTVGTLIRDCVTKCKEEVTHSATTLCCQENGCNFGNVLQQPTVSFLMFLTICAIIFHRFH